MAKLRQTPPLVDDEMDGLPKYRIRLHEPVLNVIAEHLCKASHLRQRMGSMMEHALVRIQAPGVREIVDFEDFFVDLTGECVFPGTLVLHATNLQVNVRVAHRFIEFVAVSMREILRGPIGHTHGPSVTAEPSIRSMLHELVDDLTGSTGPAGVMFAGLRSPPPCPGNLCRELTADQRDLSSSPQDTPGRHGSTPSY